MGPIWGRLKMVYETAKEYVRTNGSELIGLWENNQYLGKSKIKCVV